MILAALRALFKLVALCPKLGAVLVANDALGHAFALVQIVARDAIVAQVVTVATIARETAHFVLARLITHFDRFRGAFDMANPVLIVSGAKTLVQIVLATGPSETRVNAVAQERTNLVVTNASNAGIALALVNVVTDGAE